MLFRRAADVVAVSHLTIIGFLLGGGFLARRHPRLTKAHLIVLAGTAAIYAGGLDCPLTDWEKGLRHLAGDEVYPGGYLEHYIVAPVHPAGMNPTIGFGLVGVVAAATAAAYRDRLRLPDRSRTAPS
ncbi:MAG: hypothetical protein QOE93_2313 [Actinomycetota bacterium]|jgi:hypothetical protein|nr:hypothetical protein [Actinomycetota bacterium]